MRPIYFVLEPFFQSLSAHPPTEPILKNIHPPLELFSLDLGPPLEHSFR